MADIAAVYQGAQFGIESTPGTGVAANKKFNAFGLTIQPQAEIEMFSPVGTKLQTLSLYGPEWVQCPFQGKMDYTQLAYILAAHFKDPGAPGTDGTNGKKYLFDISPSSADDIITYTVEVGSDIRAQKFTYGHINELTLEMSKRASNMSGSFIGQRLTDDVTLTAGPTAVALNVIQPSTFDVKIADTQAGLEGASVFARPFKATLKIANRFSQIFCMGLTNTSFVAHVEGKPAITLELMVGADDADMVFLSNLRAGTSKFIRIESIGPVITGAIPSAYTFQLDFCGQLTQHYAPGEDQGALVTSWTFGAVYDPTWTKALEIMLINSLVGIT